MNAPVLALPTEIVCTIFKLLVRPPPPLYPTEHKHKNKPQKFDIRLVRTEIIVSQVCRLWRSMALTYPNLWSTFAHDDLWGQQIPVDLLRTYLERSRSCPLDLYFRLDDRKRDDWLDTVDSIRAAATLSRLRTFSLRIGRRWPAFHLFSEIERLAAPSLEVFEVCCPEFKQEIGLPWLERPFFMRGTPKLLSLRMDARSFEYCSREAWDNMTTVTIQIERDFILPVQQRCPWKAFTALIRCRHLEHLTLAGAIFSLPHTSDLGHPTISRNLVHFRCSDMYVNEYMWLLFRAPKLELLIIKNFSMTSARFPQTTVGIRDDPDLFPSLSTLVLIGCCPGHGSEATETALNLANATASTARLVLVQWDSLGVMNNLLGVDSPTQVPLLWPRLEAITFLYQGRATRPRLPWQKCISMLERRSSLLKKPCKLGMHKQHADQWRRTARALWDRFVKAGFLLGEYTDKDQDECIPWPIRGDNPFDKTSSELHFLI